jgi:hypothetical protein
VGLISALCWPVIRSRKLYRTTYQTTQASAPRYTIGLDVWRRNRQQTELPNTHQTILAESGRAYPADGTTHQSQDCTATKLSHGAITSVYTGLFVSITRMPPAARTRASPRRTTSKMLCILAAGVILVFGANIPHWSLAITTRLLTHNIFYL